MMPAMSDMRERILLSPGQTFRLLKWKQNVSNVEIIYGAGKSEPLKGQGDHWHYHRASELTSIHRGAGTRLVADQIQLFDSNDLILIGPNVPHYWHFTGHSAGLSIQWNFPLEHGIWSFTEAKALERLTERSRRGMQIKGRTAANTRQRMKDLAPLAGLFRLSAFFSILAEIADAPDTEILPLSTKPFSLSGTDAHQEAIRQAVSYILAHYRESIHLNQLLELTAMSRATFARQFQQHAGKSFSSFLNQVRLQAVCKELKVSNELVSNIAFNNGFNQLSFFNRLFRREFGMNPSEFRNINRSSSL